MGLFRPVDIEKGGTGQRHHVLIAGAILDQKDDRPLRFGAFARMRIDRAHGKRTADDRLDAGAGHDLGEFQRPEEIIGVGQRDGGHAMGLAGRNHLGHADRAFQERIGRADTQMYERMCLRHVRLLPAYPCP